jgi:hypothetical protein
MKLWPAAAHRRARDWRPEPPVPRLRSAHGGMDIETPDFLRLRAALLEAFEVFDGLARELGIEYQSYAATLLGHLLYAGPLPWDDDGDVVVRARDWHRLDRLWAQLDPAAPLPFRPQKLVRYRQLRHLPHPRHRVIMVRCTGLSREEAGFRFRHPHRVPWRILMRSGTSKYKLVVDAGIDDAHEQPGLDLRLERSNVFCDFDEPVVRAPFGSVSLPRRVSPLAERHLLAKYGTPWIYERDGAGGTWRRVPVDLRG